MGSNRLALNSSLNHGLGTWTLRGLVQFLFSASLNVKYAYFTLGLHQRSGESVKHDRLCILRSRRCSDHIWSQSALLLLISTIFVTFFFLWEGNSWEESLFGSRVVARVPHLRESMSAREASCSHLGGSECKEGNASF